MDWPSIILATFLISLGVIVISLTCIVFYRLTFKPIIGDIKDRKAEEEREKAENVENNKIGNWIAPCFGIASLAIICWKTGILNPALAGAIAFPSLLGAWFAIRFQQKKEKTGIHFVDIFKHPTENFGLFIFLCLIILTCIIFIVPSLIIAYG